MLLYKPKVISPTKTWPRWPVLAVPLLFACSCATIVAPSGGPKDETPPKMMSSAPADRSTHFSSRKITVLFDEYIALKEAEKQLMVSPPMHTPPELKAKGRELVIKFKDTLAANTTYNIFLGNAVTDITEGNRFPNFSYSFATGDVIDSLSLSGRLVDAFTLENVGGALIQLYRGFDDSVPRTCLPVYVTRSGADGSFRLNSLASGSYRILALKDANGDYLYNMPNEWIAFGSDAVSPGYVSPRVDSLLTDTLKAAAVKLPPSQDLRLLFFKEADTVQHIKKAGMVSPDKFSISFKQSVADFSLKDFAEPSRDWTKWMEWNETHDSLQVWLAEKPDTLKLLAGAKNMPTDTLIFSSEFRNKNTQNKARERKLSFTHNAPGGQLPFNAELLLTFDNPLKEAHPETMALVRTDQKDTVAVNGLFVDSLRRQLKVNIPPLSTGNMRLILPKGSFSDYFGLSNDSLAVSFKKIPKEDFGHFVFTLTGNEGQSPRILQLLDEKGKFILEKQPESHHPVDFGYLKPGKYRIRLITDLNANGKWDAGNLKALRQPEPVLMYPKTVEVRPNWDNEEEWQL